MSRNNEMPSPMLAIAEDAAIVKSLAWAADKLITYELKTDSSNIALCECIWRLFDIAGDAAKRIEKAAERGE